MRRIRLTSAVAFALTSVASATDPGRGDLLYDNGLSFVNGLSHQSGQGQRRSILDDFTWQGPAWSISDFHIKFAWADGTTGIATDFELVFYGDDGGEPNYTVYAVAENRTVTETRDPSNPNFFGLTVVDIWVEFDKFLLEAGTYWVDMHVAGPVNGFQVVGEHPQSRGAPVWADYEDFGGRQPGREVFGDDYDVFFQITGKEVPGPGAAVLLCLAGVVSRGRQR